MSSSPNPPMPPATRKSGGAGGIITAILAIICIVLAVVAITLYSQKDAAERGKKTAEEAKLVAESQLTAAKDAESKARAETQRVLGERNDRYVAVAQLPPELQAARPSEVVERIRQLSSGVMPASPVVGGSAAQGATRPLAGGVSDTATLAMEAVAKVVVTRSFDTRADPRADPAKQQMHRQIQTALARIGAFSKPVTGSQKDTMDAVMAFQRANKLKVDGIVGRGTWGKVREKFEAMSRVATPAPSPATGN